MRIGICGTQSVGKTTLVGVLKVLPQFSKYKFFTERSEYLKSLGVPLNSKSTFNGQLLFMAERASELMHENIITDRTSIDVAAFTETSEIDDKAKTGINFLLLELSQQYDIIIYMPIMIPLKDNGVRDIDEEYRHKIDINIRKLLSHPYVSDKVYIMKNKDIKRRVNEVLDLIKNKK